MTVAQRNKTVYKRVERDGEFHDRLRAAGWPRAQFYFDVALDDYAWANARMQRRLVDDYA
jgi:hypothetical protein